MSVVGPVEARPADGLAVDFVVEADRAQLGEIVQRVRDGRLRTNIGTTAIPRRCRRSAQLHRAAQGKDDHPRSPVSDVEHPARERLARARSTSMPGHRLRLRHADPRGLVRSEAEPIGHRVT